MTVDRLTSLAAAFCLLACSTPLSALEGPKECNVTIKLPDFEDHADRDPPRVYSLKIDGKDYTEPRPKPRSEVKLKLKPAPGKDTAEMVMTFWPVIYSKTVRTKRVKLKPGEEVVVDFTVEDKETPDIYEPIYYPSPKSLQVDICKFAKITSKDTVMDIGCGDGRLVITAVKEFKAKKGLGLDIKDDLIKLCQANARKDKVTDRAEFKVADALKLKPSDISEASVVFIYLGEDLSGRLEPLLRKLKPGSRVVSLDFPIGKWAPDETKKIVARNDKGIEYTYTLYLWNIKAEK
jgi:SAM-dependent methyltransferase